MKLPRTRHMPTLLLAFFLVGSPWTPANPATRDGLAALKRALNHPDTVKHLWIGDFQQPVSEVPDSLGQLKALESLQLHVDAPQLPAVLTQLPKLQELGVVGTVSTLEALSQLTGLQELSLHVAAKALPDDLSRLTRLRRLDLDGTDLESLPASFAKLTGLRELYLNGTRLNPLPDPLWRLAKLEVLVLDSLRLSSLPPGFSHLKGLSDVAARDNALSELPPGVAGMSRLQSIVLANNRFRQWPPGLSRLPALAEVDLTSNEVASLPETVSLPNLAKLYLGRNRLTSLPNAVTRLSALTELHVWSNQLSHLPDQLGRLRHLEQLLARDNRLTRLPPLRGLTALTVLDADFNQLSELPGDLGGLSQLRGLFVSFNRLKTLPNDINRLSALEEMDAAGNGLVSLPAHWEGLKALKYLDLPYNHLSALPESLGRLEQLERLYLAGNELTAVPASIGRLHSLEVLDLSDNHLKTLPASIGELSSLRVLRLSDNPLQDLPASFGKLKALQSLHVDNTPLSTDTLARIQRQLPQLRIVSGRFPWPKRQRELFLSLMGQLNGRRRAAGLMPLSWDALASLGAEAHSRYLVANEGNAAIAGLSAHKENQSLPGYTHEGAHDDMRLVSLVEVLSPDSPPDQGLDDLLATILHRSPLIAPGQHRVGFGFASNNGRDGWLAARSVSDGKQYRILVDYGKAPEACYPPDGATDVPLRMVAEIPNTTPKTDPDGQCGYPFAIAIPGWLGPCTAMTATFTDAAGNVEPAWALTPQTCAAWGVYPDAKYHVMAKNPLKPRTQYTLTVQMQGRWGRSAERTLHFTTGPS